MRIIQQRLSRRNSLTLLQLQNLNELNSKFNEKKAPHSGHSSFGKKSGSRFRGKGSPDHSGDNFKESIISDRLSEVSSVRSSSSEGNALDSIPQKSHLMAIQVRANQDCIIRKSNRFKTMLKYMN